MKVKDLILVLQTFDPELDVVMDAGVDGAEGTANDIDVPEHARILRNENKEYWRGTHDFMPFWNESGAGDEVIAIVPARRMVSETK